MRTRRDGFTLVELLVVVGIISILVAFLMPALQRAREQAIVVQDLSNIRQVAMVAIGMYSSDYQGQVVPTLGIQASQSAFDNIQGYLYLMDGGGITIALDGSQFPPGSPFPYNASWADLLHPYLRGSKPARRTNTNPEFSYSPVFYCAGDWGGMDGGDPRVGWWANGYFREWSWRINYDVTPIAPTPSPAHPIFGRRVSSIHNASNKVLFAESHYECVYGDRWGVLTAQGHLWGAGVLTDKPVNRNSRWSPKRHGLGFAAAFCDGSARIIPFAARDAFVGSAATYLTCYATMGVGENWDLDAR